ncbi:hypothetical protein niasHT_000744 [Heterodera trifolii]|uniref:Uncharacterized protein n=1 Tax=Heterodera trifolii TaxID=157864 RepID=A0ABD2LNI0_9BILA
MAGLHFGTTMVAIDRVVLCFFVLFLSVYFLESIGGFYMTRFLFSLFSCSPEWWSPPGNRARWIGGGCTLIAIANILISSSNFVFTDFGSGQLAIAQRNFARFLRRFAQFAANNENPSVRLFLITFFCHNFLGLLILGVDRTMPFSLGLPLIDDNVRKKQFATLFRYWYFTNVAIDGHRSISLGFNGFLVSLLATLPSPIAWGTIIDNFCLFWTQKCGEKGACALYATDGLRFWLHFAYDGLRIVSLITVCSSFTTRLD